MKRSPFKAKPPTASAAKQRKCKVKACRAPFTPHRGFQDWCSPECGAVLAQERLEKQRLAEQRRDSAEHRAKLADSKPLSHWLKTTERVVNHYVLVRDRALPCISCGTFDTVQWEAGHFKSVGAHREMRFLANNIHKQCHRCNVQFSGNLHGYRAGLLTRYGQEIIDQLEAPHPMLDPTRESLADIRRTFAAMTRALEKGAANDDNIREAA